MARLTLAQWVQEWEKVRAHSLARLIAQLEALGYIIETAPARGGLPGFRTRIYLHSSGGGYELGTERHGTTEEESRVAAVQEMVDFLVKREEREKEKSKHG